MLEIINRSLQKHIAIFGGGRTGIPLARKLVKLGYCVHVFDKNPAILSFNKLKVEKTVFYKIDEDIIEAKSQIHQVMVDCEISKFKSIFHTYLYDADEFNTFISIVSDYSDHFGTIGTLLTFDRKIDNGILNENSPKISTDDLYISGGYPAGKLKLEIAIQNYIAESNGNKKFFLASTFHIAGKSVVDDKALISEKGWIPGITEPYFRSLNLLNDLSLNKGSLALAKQGDILYQIIDIDDLSDYISLGISKELNGEYIILNDTVISSAEYYTIIGDIVGIKNLKITEAIGPLIDHSGMMRCDWVASNAKFMEAVGEVLKFTKIYTTLEKSVIELQKQTKGMSIEDMKRHTDIWSNMNTPPPPDMGRVTLEIQRARNEFNKKENRTYGKNR